MSLYHHPTYLLKALAEREQNGLLRKLSHSFPGIDFCSNDYLGFSRLGLLDSKSSSVTQEDTEPGEKPRGHFGATGSRLISGNTRLMEEAEKQIALFHHAQSALIFNSGYDANVGLLSSVPQKQILFFTTNTYTPPSTMASDSAMLPIINSNTMIWRHWTI